MCERTERRKRVTIGGVPTYLVGCAQHWHGRATIGFADGSTLDLAAKRRTEIEVLACLDAMIEHAFSIQNEIASVPCMASLFAGFSVVDPGARVSRETRAMRSSADALAHAVLSGDTTSAPIAANALLVTMLDRRAPRARRKRAEVCYTSLVRAGLEHGISIPLLQRTHNYRSHA